MNVLFKRYDIQLHNFNYMLIEYQNAENSLKSKEFIIEFVRILYIIEMSIPIIFKLLHQLFVDFVHPFS